MCCNTFALYDTTRFVDKEDSHHPYAWDWLCHEFWLSFVVVMLSIDDFLVLCLHFHPFFLSNFISIQIIFDYHSRIMDIFVCHYIFFLDWFNCVSLRCSSFHHDRYMYTRKRKDWENFNNQIKLKFIILTMKVFIISVLVFLLNFKSIEWLLCIFEHVISLKKLLLPKKSYSFF